MGELERNKQRRGKETLSDRNETKTNIFPGDEHLRGMSRAGKPEHPKPHFSQPPDAMDTGNRLTPDYGPIPTKEGNLKFAAGHDINGA
jgi:hypothetical protein